MRPALPCLLLLAFATGCGTTGGGSSGGGSGSSGGGASASGGGATSSGGGIASSGGGTSSAGGGSASAGGGTSSSGGGTSSSGGGAGCMAGAFLQSLGKTRLMVGGTMEDPIATQAAWDVRYLYISGGYFDGNTPCASCATSCTAQSKSCKNGAGGCPWWGCYQYDQDPPGDYARAFIAAAKAKNQLPMFTYYEFLQGSQATEGPGQVAKTTDLTFMTKYFNDWRFLLQQVGNEKVILHVEPDLWGYAQAFNANPAAISAKVKAANATDCGTQADDFTGFGKCLVAMARKYAPNAKVGFTASAWASGVDVNINKNASFDVVAEAKKVANYLKLVGGADGDFVVVEALDRDAGFYQVVRMENRFWDTTNATLPNFTQHFTWAKAIAETVGKPLLWWQLPVGNMTLANTPNHYKDNRADYFMGHLADVAKAHGALVAFGEGDGDQTTLSTDNGHVVGLVKAYLMGAGQVPCP